MSEPFTVPSYTPAAVRRGGDAVLVGAIKALRTRRWQVAERTCQQVLRIDPDHPLAVHLLGLAAHRGGDVFDAVSLLRRSVELDPSQPLWWFNLGVSYAAGGRHADAAESFRATLGMQPYHVPSLWLLGRSLYELGLLHDAVAALTQVLRLELNHDEAEMLLAVITQELRTAA